MKTEILDTIFLSTEDDEELAIEMIDGANLEHTPELLKEAIEDIQRQRVVQQKTEARPLKRRR